mgnify:CR=1 FL=1
MEHQQAGEGWPAALRDPSGRRAAKPRRTGRTMVIDKGLGLRAFEDMLAAAADYIDIVKFGFGTSCLYPPELLRRKTAAAAAAGVLTMPGGTLLEAAAARGLADAFFASAAAFGFTAIEVSDGTIEMNRDLRSALIVKALDAGFTVVTEFGKKRAGFRPDAEELAKTVEIDTALGAEFVTIEARESGKNAGIFDENGSFRAEDAEAIVRAVPCGLLMWEAPLKTQQAKLLQLLGPDLNIGNVAPEDALALEALRRGLRSDTFAFGAGAAAGVGQGADRLRRDAP